jgi:hypothetical protein
MQRNPDILRDIMLAAEMQPAGHILHLSSIKTVTDNYNEIADHIQQLIDADYVDGVVHLSEPGTMPNAIIRRVKHNGYEFLQAMREDTVWKWVKEKVMIPGASWTLAIAAEAAKDHIRKHLGLQ